MATKKQIIIPALILVVGVCAMVVFSSMKKPPEEKAEIDLTPIVAVEEISLQPVNLDVYSHGVVQPKFSTDLVAQVSGQIVELSEHFVRGGFIKKGQVLAVIDPSDYEAALIEADANLATARAALELEKAQGKVAEKEWQRIKDTSPTELSLRKPQLAQEMAKVKAAEASVKRAKRNLERTKIISPYDAMIESREIGLGSYVGVGKNLGKILNVAVAKVRLPVADNQLQFLIASGEKAKVILTSDYAGVKQQWHAEIVRSEGVIDDSSRMNYLVAEISDPYGLASGELPLRYGSYVNAVIKGAKASNVAMVPRHLVADSKVAVFSPDSKLVYKDVTILRQQGSQVIISAGLNDGDLIISSALDFPLAGMKLALAPENQEQPATQEAETQLALKDK
ncbi:efflux RND transporter periplasmic adaptor subunit [Thalassomonas sp. M1454]|uniref:efflux RND transporter periplasmic adaptor subunit n=1 Tax=Thalassomonas sp. M1454 TaxID=2594477 RepID=UPI001180896D|nr:efflux RND transporter periplasmic adaptor subunit [Thalassomonas sp. M1454]TRX54046.1 efflux RND transporter periplasmic adaptor subunit [Thalassomonas sp. M1454]